MLTKHYKRTHECILPGDFDKFSLVAMNEIQRRRLDNLQVHFISICFARVFCLIKHVLTDFKLQHSIRPNCITTPNTSPNARFSYRKTCQRQSSLDSRDSFPHHHNFNRGLEFLPSFKKFLLAAFQVSFKYPFPKFLLELVTLSDSHSPMPMLRDCHALFKAGGAEIGEMVGHDVRDIVPRMSVQAHL